MYFSCQMRCQLENIRKPLSIIEPAKSGPKHNGGRKWEIEHVVEHRQSEVFKDKAIERWKEMVFLFHASASNMLPDSNNV